MRAKSKSAVVHKIPVIGCRNNKRKYVRAAAGQGVGLIHDIRPAKGVVETMMAEAKAIPKRLSVSL